jgi:opacity protein-like surface antigen
MLTYSEPGFDASPKAVRLVVGKNLNDQFAIEGLVAANAGSSPLGASGLDVSVPTMFGVYAKAFTKLNDQVELFGRLGWASVNRKASVSSGTLSVSLEETGNGISYGAGIKYTLSKDISIFADYMSYYPEKNGISINGFTLGAGFSF